MPRPRPGTAAPTLALLLLALAGLIGACASGSGGSGGGGEPRAGAKAGPDHLAWSSALDRTEDALARGDLAAARAGAVETFEQGLRFPDSDPRVADTIDVVRRIWIRLQGSDEAVAFTEALVARARDSGRELHPLEVRARWMLARSLAERGRYDEAEREAGRLRRDLSDALGPGHHEAVTALTEEAAMVAARDERRALALLEEALPEIRRALGPSPQTVRVLIGMGRLQLYLGRPDDAERSYGEALGMARQANPYSPDVAEAEDALGGVALFTGDLRGAESHFERALAIHEVTYGDREPGLAHTELSLANIRFARGDVADALRRIERALGILEGIFGPDHPSLTQPLIQLASIYVALGLDAEASAAVRRATRIVDAVPEPSAGMLREVGSYEAQVLDSASGIRKLERALRLAEERGLERAIGWSLNELAYALALDGQGKRAVPLARRAVEMAQRMGYTQSLTYPARLDTLGVAHVANGEAGEGLARLDRALRLIELIAGPDSPMAFQTKLHRAQALRALGETEAEAVERQVAEQRRLLVVGLVASPSLEPPAVVSGNGFRLSVPRDAWVVLPSGTGVENADVTLQHKSLPILVGIAGFVRPDLRSFEEWRAISQETLDSQNPTNVERSPLRLSGVEGELVRAETYSGGSRSSIETWYGRRGDHTYVLYASSTTVSREALRAEVAALQEGFEATGPERATAGDTLRSERFGYVVDLSGLGWSEDAGRSGAELAELGARAQHASLVTLPVSLLGLRVDDARLARALAALFGIEDPGAGSPVREGGLQGLDFRMDRGLASGARQQLRLRVLQHDGRACLVLAAVEEPATGHDAVLAAVERFRWEGPARVAGAEDLEPAEKRRQQAFLDQLASGYLKEQRFADGVAVMHRRLDLTPEDAAFREQLASYESGLGRYRDALATVDEGLALDPDRAGLWVIRGIAVRRVEGPAASLDAYRRGFELGYENEDVLLDFVDALWEAGERDEAFAQLEAGIARSGSLNLRLKRVALRRESGDLEGALAEIEELEAQQPKRADVLVEVVLVNYASGRHREAIDAADRLLAETPGSWEVLYLKAQAQVASGQVAEAKATIDEAARMRPESAEVQELQNLLAGALGRGGQRGVREPIEPLEIPLRLRGGVAAKPPPGAEDHGAYYAVWIEALRFVTGEPQRRTTTLRAHIVDARGLDQFSNLQYEFNPLVERIYVNAVRSYDASGALVGEADPTQQAVMDAASSPEVGSTKVLNVPIPGLEIGGWFEATLSRVTLGEQDRFEYRDALLSRSIPVQRSILYVEGDVDQLNSRAGGGPKRTSGDGWVAWSAERPEPYRWEPLQSPGLEHLPRVRIGDARDTWASLTRDYLEDLGPYLAPADGVPELVAREGGGDPQRLAELVQDRLRYEAIAFGPRARIPKPIDQTLRERYGDCKDHSLLLVQVLREAGHDADLALVNATTRIEPDVPALAQFDHMVVRCADCPGPAWMDATDKAAALGRSAPRTLGGRRALVLDAENPRLETIPEPGAAQFAVRIDRQVRLSDAGSLAVREEVAIAGHLGARVRSSLRGTDRASWENELKREILGDAARLPSASIGIENAEQRDAPLRLSWEYEIDDAFKPVGGALVGALPHGWEKLLLSVEGVNDRSSPFEIQDPLEIVGRVSLELPPGFSARVVGSQGESSSTPFMDWRASGEPVRQGLRIDFRAAQRPGVYPAERYQAYFEEVTRAIGFLDQPIEVRGPGGE